MPARVYHGPINCTAQVVPHTTVSGLTFDLSAVEVSKQRSKTTMTISEVSSPWLLRINLDSDGYRVNGPHDWWVATCLLTPLIDFLPFRASLSLLHTDGHQVSSASSPWYYRCPHTEFDAN